MARNERRRREYSAPSKNFSWQPVLYVPGNKNYASARRWLIDKSNPEQWDIVCERQRLIAHFDTTSSDPEGYGAIFSIVLPQFVLTGKNQGDDISSQVASPFNNEVTDNYPLFQPFSTEGQVQYTIDSKAKRKLSKDEVLALVLSTDGGLSANIRVLGRCLFSWKI